MRPNTEGCTEQSCMYHGGDNRFKAAHHETCPIHTYAGPILELVDQVTEGRPPAVRCECQHQGPHA